MGILVKAHIAKAPYSESSSTEIVVKLVVTGPGSSRHPSSSEKSSFYDRESGEEVNFVISDNRNTLGAVWNLGVAFLLHNMRIHFRDVHNQSPYISSGRCALQNLFTLLKVSSSKCSQKEVERLLSCDLDVKNSIWRSLSCSPRENRFFNWLTLCRLLNQRTKSGLLLSQNLGSGCLALH